MLCQLLLTGLTDMIKASKSLDLATDYQIIAISMAKEDTLKDLKNFKEKYTSFLDEKKKSNFHFLLAEDSQVKTLSKSVGFSYKYVEETQDYAHQAALIFLNREQIVSRYLYGIKFIESDIKKALIESTKEEKRSVREKLIMFCYQYDPDKNSYVIQSLFIMRLVCLLTALILAIVIVTMIKKENLK